MIKHETSPLNVSILFVEFVTTNYCFRKSSFMLYIYFSEVNYVMLVYNDTLTCTDLV